MNIVTIVGARPQFIKSLPVSNELRKSNREILVHTGQHYDRNMSDIFFEEMGIPKPDYNLGVGSGGQGEQTARMLSKIEAVLLDEKPDAVLIYGDTNSTLAGALAAAKLHIPVAHVEAGLRSFDKKMPEEINRIVADHVSDLLFCPTKTAVDNLKNEGITKGVELVGDVMYDAALHFGKLAEEKSRVLEELDLAPKGYLLATIHRSANTDNIDNLKALLEAFAESDRVIVFPVHPRTRKVLANTGLDSIIKGSKVRLVDPVGYIDFLKLENNAVKILTDSGGVQKEAFFAAVPCITLRDTTEWVETVESGWNILVHVDKDLLLKQIAEFNPVGEPAKLFGDGKASFYIAQRLTSA
ncbi:MAG: UDP-N-acetylglucosamine 2-epimerase (non-hydrolyzing) [Candidatus Aquicultor secundus]|uniref:UDP-N-acetylglucosamine 2-epimerase (Non-hydrolyzing) n=1 Tax=Candidatus Aquicultor secundus TaxID=1973895 RepID=A0A2M7TAR2_9ACTN|nr:UDP-N-acetylglucosamine 2-epimerase (non-hydrolyzing) [Candidatus Aquicultor secundus]NCO65772.1 UDP-N-acetylglucosamine 2-epimerase (non-hydrolyzing) [Solirubrobacter sp.]OIO86096.1 MAG: UDP-N-acetylglucosamine 2-epimerase [Candidatus Aquicultor secundus]PIU26978.1 MAG: UDP-N-acetylglucosamine 2-epimerase (non-hydrolyzing) [Candidatus Aquicultor secundus]PIW22329.1 MAG: UDP-N-acetylglucosamine 2-epimerase (non-hydrolyzing) [Candidatus Aquicultor secundus]PIX51394.1 MAG: UDP-N-acetylglucosa